MHQPKESSEEGTRFCVRGLAPPDMRAALATACSTRANGSLPAAMYRQFGQLEPSTFTSPDSMRRKSVFPPSDLPDLRHTALAVSWLRMRVSVRGLTSVSAGAQHVHIARLLARKKRVTALRPATNLSGLN